MERPIPDGKLVLRFTQAAGSHNEKEIEFRNLRDWYYSENGDIVVRYVKRGDGPDRTVYLSSHMLWHHVYGNSDEYLAELKEFQKAHDHTWIPQHEHGMFGVPMESDTKFICGTSKTGEEGCLARKEEDVMIYG